MQAEKALIKFNSVSFKYSKRNVLSNINLTLVQNQFTLLIGPNGGGKSTLLKLLLGVLQPTDGSIEINGKEPIHSREYFGYVPQNLEFDRHFPISVKEFVSMGALSLLTWYGRFPKSVNTRVDEVLKLVEMQDYINSPPSALSGGQKQRIAIARALMPNPEILVLDEPLSGLDSPSSMGIVKLLQELKGNKTILLVTHSIDRLMDFADKIICVNESLSILNKDKVCSHLSKGLYLPEEEKSNGR